MSDRISSFEESAKYIVVPASDAALDDLLAGTMGPVVVVTSTANCYPCAMIKPIMRKLAIEFRGRMTLVETENDRTPTFLRSHGVKAHPTLLMFSDGRLQRSEVGFSGAEETYDLVARLIGSDAETPPSAAEQAFRAAIAEATAAVDTFMQPTSDALAPHYEAAQPQLETLEQQRKDSIALGMSEREAHAICVAARKELLANFADKIDALRAAQAEALLAYSRSMDQSITAFARASARDKPSLVCSPDGSVCHVAEPDSQRKVKS